MIRFGPSGIPLSCKGRTLRDGIEDVHTLGLTAMEIQLVRINVIERYVRDEDVGLSLRDVENELPVEILRKSGKKEQVISTLKEKIKSDDVLRILSAGIAKDYKELNLLGEIARELDVQLSLHTPYYMDLSGSDEMTKKSMNNIRWGSLIANEMGATHVVTHLGLYGGLSKKAAIEKVVKNLKEVTDWYKREGIKVALGIETSGRQEIIGNLDEVIEICKKVPGTVPVLNFSHIHARSEGNLKKVDDFQNIFDKVAKWEKKGFYCHFSGVEHEGGNEKRYTPIKKGDLRFEPLAECILDNNFNITVISGSPLLEHDAMYMKVILERVLAKREAKRIKMEREAKAKEEAKAAKLKKERKEKVAKKKTKKEPSKKPAKKKAAKKEVKKKPSKSPSKKKPVKKKAAKKEVKKKPSKSPPKKKLAKKKVPKKSAAKKKAVMKKPAKKKVPKKTVKKKTAKKKPSKSKSKRK